VDFDVIGSIRSSISINTGEKVGVQCTVQQLFVDFMKVYDSVRREILYSFSLSLLYPGN
jgi:hypothetical protein